jgi:hypothetical protein
MATSFIYEDQDALRLSADTKLDISSATTFQIGYFKPDGTEGILTGSRSTTKVVYDLPLGSTLFHEGVGLWTFWADVTMADGRKAYGKPFQQRVYQKGKTK